MPETYLVTGGAGFIGSHLCEELTRRGHSVRVLDDLSTGNLNNLKSLDGNSLKFIRGSVTDPEIVTAAMEGVDAVFHLAAAVGVQLVFERPTHTIETNIRGSEVVLEQAAKSQTRIFVASTSEVYGKGVKIPLAETDDLLLGPTTCPRWSYACSKAIDEFLALAYHKEQSLPVVIGRFFNTVGPRQSGQYGMVIPRFIDQAKRGEEITVYGDGSQTRCFGYVKDVVRAVIELMDNPAARGKVFNIGNNDEISILDLAKKIITATRSKSKIRLVPFEEAYGPDFEDMQRRVPDLTKISAVIEWNNLTDMDEIIQAILAWQTESESN